MSIAPDDAAIAVWILAVGVSAALFGLGRGLARPRCDHKWKVIHERATVNRDNTPYRHTLVLQCENCGDIRRRRG